MVRRYYLSSTCSRCSRRRRKRFASGSILSVAVKACWTDRAWMEACEDWIGSLEVGHVGMEEGERGRGVGGFVNF